MKHGYDISEYDFGVIQDLVNSIDDRQSYFDLITEMVKLFGKDIKAIHYIVLGYLVGVSSAANFKQSDENQINLLCQRQNWN